jgi:molybdate transport system ATP-binding protein
MIEFAFNKTVCKPDGPAVLRFEGVLAPGERVVIFGESGAGKSTLLRMLAGLDRPDAGFLSVGGEVWYDSRKGISMPTQRRDIGMVFQDSALFPNLTVRQNVEFGVPPGAPSGWVDELLEATGLAGLATRDPRRISGGQAQRVALARAAARMPRLLLLDEPMTSLDPVLRHKLQSLVLGLHERLGCVTVLVSHDLAEIERFGGRILWIHDNQLRPVEGTRELVSLAPGLKEVAPRFLQE